MDNHMDEETVRRWKTEDTVWRWKAEDTIPEHRTVEAYEKLMGPNPPKRRRLENGNASEPIDADGVIEIPRREIAKTRKGRKGT